MSEEQYNAMAELDKDPVFHLQLAIERLEVARDLLYEEGNLYEYDFVSSALWKARFAYKELRRGYETPITEQEFKTLRPAEDTYDREN